MTPRDLLRRLDDRPTGTPSAGHTYAAALRSLVVAIGRTPEVFDDPEVPLATTAFLVHRFLAAESAQRGNRPDDVPLPWRTALVLDPARPVLRLLLVTANAGLNDDLPRALLDLPGWDGSGSRADHTVWTGLMADAFADVACGTAAGPVARLTAARERPLVRRALVDAGEQAWRNAEDLHGHRVERDGAGSVGTDADVVARGRLLATVTTGRIGELLTRHRWPAPGWSELLVVRL